MVKIKAYGEVKEKILIHKKIISFCHYIFCPNILHCTSFLLGAIVLSLNCLYHRDLKASIKLNLNLNQTGSKTESNQKDERKAQGAITLS